MLNIRKSNERGKGEYGWLKAKYSFSFARYFDPKHVGARDLVVLNEDVIAPGQGFGDHPHRDMEIITYVIKGAIEHKDSMGYRGVVRPGEIQYMSAGTGITHSEFNYLKDSETHLIQLWIRPDQIGHTPNYGQASFKERLRANELCLIVSGDGRKESVNINQDISIFTASFTAGFETSYEFKNGGGGWAQLISGCLNINGELLESGDGLSITNLSSVDISSISESNFLLFDL